MRIILALVAAMLAVGAAPAAAQHVVGVEMEAGQALTVSLGNKGHVEVVRRGRAEWTPHDLAAARHLSGQPVPDAPVPNATPLPSSPDGPRVPAVESGVVNLRFMTVADRHALLIVENGYGQALRYRAQMTVRGNTRPTDVCVVLPANRSYEHWPHPIERILVYEFALVPWDGSNRPSCE